MRGTARVGREGRAGKAGARSTASKAKGRRERRLKDDAIRAAFRHGAPRRVLFFRVTAVFLAGQKPRPSEAHGADEW
jgi:hypothetical protein